MANANQIIINGEIKIDLTNDTVTPADLAAGVTAHNAAGDQITGEMINGMPVGFQYFSTNPNIPVGSLPLTGGEYSRAAYADLWAWVQTQTNYLISESAWQAKATANEGNVPFYSTGDGSTTFRVPSLSCWVKGANGVSEVGSYLKAGLPNITGSFNFTNDSGAATGFSSKSTALGAFGKVEGGSGKVVSMANSSAYRDTEYNIDASRSSAIYGNSDTVQPPSIVGMWLVKAFGTVSNIGNQDIADVSAGLTAAEQRLLDMENNITNVSDLVHIAENYADGTEWYRIWSDGRIEQGGYCTGSGYAERIVTLHKPFSDTNYAVFITGSNGRETSSGTNYWYSKTTTTVGVASHGNCNWYACGY